MDITHFHDVAYYDAIPFADEGHTRTLRCLKVPGYGAVAYAISPAGIRKTIRAAYPLERPIDVTVREISRVLADRTVEPFASRNGCFASEIR